jgi:HSP20 family molecular chaperone IbpA
VLPKSVTPEPGFCVKTKTDKNEKVFINICQSSEIPSPQPITDEQLLALLESGDPTNYRVPLSLGEPHTEKDNSGSSCTAYDVIVGNDFYSTVQNRSVMKDFLLTIVLEGLEEKYSLKLCRECKIMKNRKFIGVIPEQTVRSKPKPFIIEMTEEEKKSSNHKDTSCINRPEFTIIREPADGDVPEYLVMEVKLPNVKSSRFITLDVGEDRLELSVRPNMYNLDIDLPYYIEPNDTGAQYNIDNNILTITLHVTGLPPSV